MTQAKTNPYPLDVLLTHPPGTVFVSKGGKGSVLGYDRPGYTDSYETRAPFHWLRVRWLSGIEGSYPTNRMKIVND